MYVYMYICCIYTHIYTSYAKVRVFAAGGPWLLTPSFRCILLIVIIIITIIIFLLIIMITIVIIVVVISVVVIMNMIIQHVILTILLLIVVVVVVVMIIIILASSNAFAPGAPWLLTPRPEEDGAHHEHEDLPHVLFTLNPKP